MVFIIYVFLRRKKYIMKLYPRVGRFLIKYSNYKKFLLDYKNRKYWPN